MSNAPAFQSDLVAALRHRLAIIGDAELRARDPASQLAQLQQASETLARLTAELPLTSDPRLRHYLTQCSYSKALEHLESGLG